MGFVVVMIGLAVLGALIGFDTRYDDACSDRGALMFRLSDEELDPDCEREANTRLGVAAAAVIGGPVAGFVLTRPEILHGSGLTRVGVWVLAAATTWLVLASLVGESLPYHAGATCNEICRSDPGALAVGLVVAAVGLLLIVGGLCRRPHMGA